MLAVVAADTSDATENKGHTICLLLLLRLLCCCVIVVLYSLARNEMCLLWKGD